MRKIFFFATFTLSLFSLAAQDKNTVPFLVQQGIKLHDAGHYDSALLKFHQALEIDPGNMNALYEMSYTFYINRQYDSAVYLSNKLIAAKPTDAILKNVYVNLGSSFDDLNEPDKAINTYNEGLKKFPGFYLLYFNKGVTLLFSNQKEKAKEAFEKTLILNPLHSGSHYWLSTILTTENKIPAIMAASMDCITETNSIRSSRSAFLIDSLLMQNNVSKDSSSKNITIQLPVSALNKKKENDFASAELGLILSQASLITDSSKSDSHKKQFEQSYQMLCGFFESHKKQKGFYWSFYAPFFYAAKQNGYTEVIINLILQQIDNGESAAWLAAHHPDVEKFNDWLNNFPWQKK